MSTKRGLGPWAAQLSMTVYKVRGNEALSKALFRPTPGYESLMGLQYICLK